MMRHAFRVLALILCGLVAIACQVQKRQSPPSIEFTTVPEAAAGGSGRAARIAGRATGAGPGQQVVLYAKSGVWWVR
jgi:hypothetical protein